MSSEVVFYRDTVGIGDAVMLLRAIEIYHKQHPYANITVIMDRPASCVYNNHPAISDLLPANNFFATQASAFFKEKPRCLFYNLSNPCAIYEAKHSSRHTNITKDRFDLFAEAIGVEYDGRPPTIYVTPEERHVIRGEIFLTNREYFYGRPLVGVVWRTNDISRNYPHTNLLVEYLLRKNIGVVLIDDEYTINGCFCTAGMDFQKVVWLIAELDFMVGGDTGPMHVAAAMGIPTLWLFGPTDPTNRTYPYENVEFIWRPCDATKPCWYNFCNSLDCLWNISPWKVGKWILKHQKNILTKHTGVVLKE